MKVNGFCPEGTLIYTEENAAFLTEAGLARAKEEGRILEGRAALCDQENNLHVELADGLVGLIPRAEALLDDSARSVAILSRVGRPVCFQVIGSTLRDGKRFPLLSRRAAQAACFSSYVRGLTPGDVIGARITHLTQFGAFADIGCGLVSLLQLGCGGASDTGGGHRTGGHGYERDPTLGRLRGGKLAVPTSGRPLSLVLHEPTSILRHNSFNNCDRLVICWR